MSLMLRYLVPFVASLAVVLAPAPCRAAPKPLSAEEQAKVDRAIAKGIEYLKNTQRKNGSWPDKDRPLPHGMPALSMPLGYTLLPALALLESGAPATDPCVEKVAELLRRNAAKIKQTYEVSLAVLFLDRLGDPKDEELIRDLAVRLIVFQASSGGWGYPCPTLSKKNRDDLLRALRGPRDRGKPRPGAGLAPQVPSALSRLAIFRPTSELLQRDKPRDQGNRFYTDNSNTQFALLALWAARRHGLPVERSLRLAAQRFRLSQQRDGSWTYYYPTGQWGVRKPSKPAMTTVGLLSLAVDHGLSATDGAKPAPDRQVLTGFASLSREIGEPTGQMDRRLPFPETYFLWSVERVAVLYGLPDVGDKDWYRWGAEILVTNQAEDGSWPKETATDPDYRADLSHYTPSFVRTSFALLFLKRSNLTKNLTTKLPFKPAELNKGIIAVRSGGAPTGIPTPSQDESKR